MESSIETIRKKIAHHQKMIRYHEALANNWETIIHRVEQLEKEEQENPCECMDENKTTS